jgi:tRNA (mo5U34)-methyltransferase
MLLSERSAVPGKAHATRTSQERAAILERVNSLNWVHSIDLGDGITTPAKCDWQSQKRLITRAFDCTNFQDKKVLDIGCWDGLWSFEAERRGAREVYATDYVSQRHSRQQPTFEVARDALRSRAKYFPRVSVFDVSQLGVNDFDIVLFCGVFYHLRDPLLAFARLRQVMKEGAVLIVEGDVIYNRADVSAEFYYHHWHNRDASNWWVPTIPCLRQWLESSFFGEVTEIRDELPAPAGLAGRARQALRTALRRPQVPMIGRIAMTARAVRRVDPNYFYPDDDLRAFDLNDYDGG